MAKKRVTLDQAAFAADCALGMYTQEELAAKHGVSKSAVGKMIRGQRRPEVRAMIARAREHAGERARQRVAELMVRAVDVLGGLMNCDRPSVALTAARELLRHGLGRSGGAAGAGEDAGLDKQERKELEGLRSKARVLDGLLTDLSEDTRKRVLTELGCTAAEVGRGGEPHWGQGRSVAEGNAEGDEEDWDDEDDWEDEEDEDEEGGDDEEDAQDDGGEPEAGGKGEGRGFGAEQGACLPTFRAGEKPPSTQHRAFEEGIEQSRDNPTFRAGEKHPSTQHRAVAEGAGVHRAYGVANPGPGGMNAERRARMNEAWCTPDPTTIGGAAAAAKRNVS